MLILIKNTGYTGEVISITKSDKNDRFIYLENVSKSFGKLDALKNANLKIERNKITAIVGDNGSGKSTLIKILSGSLTPDKGTLYIEGRKYKYITPKIAYKNGFSTVYQDLSLDNYRDAIGNIFLGREIIKAGIIIDYKEMYKQTRALLEELNIDIPYLTTPVGYLSGGQRQSVAIARSIFQGSKLIILDEPTAAMGLKESAATNKLIKSLPSKLYTVVMVSHDLDQVYSIADRIFIMRNGTIIGDVTKKDTTPKKLKSKINEEHQTQGCEYYGLINQI